MAYNPYNLGFKSGGPISSITSFGGVSDLSMPSSTKAASAITAAQKALTNAAGGNTAGSTTPPGTTSPASTSPDWKSIESALTTLGTRPAGVMGGVWKSPVPDVGADLSNLQSWYSGLDPSKQSSTFNQLLSAIQGTPGGNLRQIEEKASWYAMTPEEQAAQTAAHASSYNPEQDAINAGLTREMFPGDYMGWLNAVRGVSDSGPGSWVSFLKGGGAKGMTYDQAQSAWKNTAAYATAQSDKTAADQAAAANAAAAKQQSIMSQLAQMGQDYQTGQQYNIPGYTQRQVALLRSLPDSENVLAQARAASDPEAFMRQIGTQDFGYNPQYGMGGPAGGFGYGGQGSLLPSANQILDQPNVLGGPVNNANPNAVWPAWAQNLFGYTWANGAWTPGTTGNLLAPRNPQGGAAAQPGSYETPLYTAPTAAEIQALTSQLTPDMLQGYETGAHFDPTTGQYITPPVPTGTREQVAP